MPSSAWRAALSLAALVLASSACTSRAAATAEATVASQSAGPEGGAASVESVTHDSSDRPLAEPVSARIARGKYLTAIGGCHDCHTPGYEVPGARIADSALLVGSPVGFQGPWGTSYAANLRLKVRALPEREWIAMVRKRSGLPPMPWPSLHHMTDADLSALYAYITSLGTSGVQAPPALPPGAVPSTPYISFDPIFPKANGGR